MNLGRSRIYSLVDYGFCEHPFASNVDWHTLQNVACSENAGENLYWHRTSQIYWKQAACVHSSPVVSVFKHSATCTHRILITFVNWSCLSASLNDLVWGVWKKFSNPFKSRCRCR